MHGEARGPLVLLLGVTAVVLLIACANIANLLLIRAASRGTELAVRLSIGASRRHVVLQLLTESCLLGILGGLGGLLMARWTLGLVVSILPPDALDVVQTSLDWRALAFAAALSIGTGLLFGLFPAISSTRPDLVSALRAQSGLTFGGAVRGAFSCNTRDGANGALDGASRCGGAFREELDERNAGRSRLEHRELGDVWRVSGAQRI